MIDSFAPLKRPTRSLLWRLLFVIVAFALMTVLSSLFVDDTLTEHLRGNALNILSQTEQMIVSELRESETLARVVTQNMREILLRGGGVRELKKYIDETSAILENKTLGYRFMGIHAYYEKSGTFIPPSNWINPPADYQATQRPWYQTAVENGDVLVSSPIYKSMRHDGYQFSYVCRIFDDRGRPLGITAVNLDVADISRHVVGTRLAKNGYGMLADEQFKIIAHPASEVVALPWGEVSEAGRISADFFRRGSDDLSEIKVKDYFGSSSIVFGKRLENGWYLGISIPRKEYYQDFSALLLFIVALGAALTAMVCVVLILIEVANNKAEAAFQDKNRQLALMAQKQAMDEYIQLLLDATPLVANIWNKDMQNLYTNEEAVRLFGLSNKQEFISRFYDLSPERQPDGQVSAELISKRLNEAFENGYSKFEWLHQTLDGKPLPCEVTLVRTMHDDEYIVAGYTRDLRRLKTAIKEMQNAIDEKNAMGYLASMFNALETMIFVTDPDTDEILFANDSLKKEFGVAGANVIGKKCHAVVKHGQSDKCADCPCFKLKNEPDKPVVWEEYDPITKRTYRSVDSYIDWPTGKRVHMQQSIDVTEYKNLLEKTKNLSDYELMKYTLTRDAFGIGLWDMEVVADDPVRPEREVIYSREFSQLLGFEGESEFPNVLGSWSDRLHPDDRDRAIEAFASHISDRSGATPFDVEYRLMIKDGTYRTFRALGNTLRDEAGTPLRVAGALDDITSEKQMMADLTGALAAERESSRLKDTAVNSLKNILDRIEALIYITTPETGELLFVNDYGKKLFDKTDDELIGQYCFNAFRGRNSRCSNCPRFRLDKEPDSIIVWDDLGETFAGRCFRHSDLYIDWHSGEKVHLQHAVDITELVAAKEMAEQSNRSKGIFLAHMSHEIRTPMNTILGTSEIYLRDKHISAYAKEGFGQINESGNLLLNIINDILDLSKIEAGKIEIEPTKYHVPSLINDTIQLFRLRYESKDVEFVVRVDENTPLELVGDELRIKQILNNLLSNAFKYSESGEIRLHVSSEQMVGGGSAMLSIQVSDTGQGMNEDQLKRLFDEYTRFNMKANRNIAGTGLGMNITKHLIDMMGGEIIVKSEVDKGTVFTVLLPQQVCTSLVCGPEITTSLQNFNFPSTAISKFAQITYEFMPYGRVLIVDDVASNLSVAVGLMAPFGMHMDIASSGFEAIEKIKHGNEYDIVFMDHMMPKMDGIATTQILREMGYDFPIVALTANVVSGQQAMFLSNGFDGFLSKPIDIRELDAVLTTLIRDKQPPEIIEAARQEYRENAIKNEYPPLNEMKEVAKYFVLDAKNAINTLNPIISKLPALEDADIESYIIATHSMKSALANINEKMLSETARTLEDAGINRDTATIADRTPVFVEALRALIKKYKFDDTDSSEGLSDSDIAFMREKLVAVNEACRIFDIKTAKAALAELRAKTWPRGIGNAIDEISLHILRGEFSKVLSFAENIAQQLPNTSP
ncbi:MAG: ATP-binding protein [Holophagaceae bacterium]|nr:ATP-binding protein [Holophagaceae bacterium]